MTVRLADDGAIILAGLCPSEDAEVLLRFLLETPAAPVDWTACEQAHTAVIQVLMAARPILRGPAGAPFLAKWIEPSLTGASAAPTLS
ncbi:hypothetical protein [Acidisoma cladoniae]|jgi:hypothetical protein|uniref:hypothetical protein n=1 Tax=Acidisoma cladoniae TaxID=3040935 RepID=UPI00254B8606|nr:hypothetical protein [Acidisoma sp. PAMC 29798]